MLKVGLTGGYATGKSFVARELERLGCHLIYADQLGHAVLEPGGEAYAPAIRIFGQDILQPDGTIDRKAVAARAFASPELLAELTSHVHPAVFRLEEQILAKIEAEAPDAIVVIEAAILIETGHYAAFDRLLLTTCDLDTQIARGMKRDGLSRDEVLRRIARQLTFEEKKPHAHYVIDTSGTKAGTVRHVEMIFEDLKQAVKRLSEARGA